MQIEGTSASRKQWGVVGLEDKVDIVDMMVMVGMLVGMLVVVMVVVCGMGAEQR